MIAFLIFLGMAVFVGGVAFGVAQKSQKALPPMSPEVHIFGDIVLPAADDPRWRRKSALGCTLSNECGVVSLEFGMVQTCIEHGVHVDGLDLGRLHDAARVKEYTRAVRAGYMTRLAMEAIESHDPDQPAATPPEQLMLSST